MTPQAVQRARRGRDFVARHGETVFNAAARIQGDHLHTPLTRAGFAQADAMGRALRERLGHRPALTLWSSPAGRALQTLAIVAEHLDLDWHDHRTDPRLLEIDTGVWGGRGYRDLADERGTIVRANGLIDEAPGGETYVQVAARTGAWLAETADDPGDRLVVTHGLAARVLRGLATGAAVDEHARVPVAPGLPQGSMVMLAGGVEALVHRGTGMGPRA